MGKVILTVARIDKAVRGLTNGNRLEIWDAMCPGLSLSIGPLRSTWNLRHKSPAAPRTKQRLGFYPLMSLSEARREAQGVRMSNLAAIPLPARSNASLQPPKAKAEASVNTITLLLDTYQNTSAGGIKSWHDARKTIENVFRYHMAQDLYSLTTFDLQKCVDAHSAKSTAALAVRCIKPVLRYGAKRGWVALDVTQLDAPAKAAPPRERVLSEEELKRVLGALTFEGYDAAVRLLLLTMCRREELMQATWPEFEFLEGVSTWTIPGGRRKNGKPLQIPLPRQAVKTLRALGGALCGPVFSTSAHWDRYQKILFARTGTSGWHRHDLRRTGATMLGQLGISPHVIEACLGHAVLHSSLASVYNQARYTREHLEALQTLADYYDKVTV